MDEKQILKQLNQLQDEVKPREKWVNITKNELLNSQQQKAAATLISKAFSPLQKPVMALTALGLLVLTLGSAMFYSPQLVEVDRPMPRIGHSESNPELSASLASLSSSLEEINEGLKNLKEVEDPNETFAIITTLESATKEGQQTAQTLATSTDDPQVLGAVGEFEENFNEIAGHLSEAQTKQEKQIETLIERIKNNKEHLTPKEQDYLERAEQSFNEGEIGLTLFFLDKINNE